MEGLNTRFKDVKFSFWEEFPIFKIVGPFKDFYKGDKTSKKIFTSTVMWAITKCCDRDSEYAEFEFELKIKEVFGDFLSNIPTTKTDWHIKYRSNLDKLIKAYVDRTTSRLEKSLITHEDKFIERGKFIGSLSYEKDLDILEKLLSNTSKIADEIESARKKVNSEKDKGSSKGDVELSLGDRGDI